MVQENNITIIWKYINYGVYIKINRLSVYGKTKEGRWMDWQKVHRGSLVGSSSASLI